MLIHRSRYYSISLGRRLKRITRHLLFSDLGVRQSGSKRVLLWLPGLVLLFLDLIALPEIYDYLSNILKSSSRYFNTHEIQIAKSVYGDALAYEYLRIDEKALIGPKHGHFAYVSYFTINCYGSMSRHTFIHELMHIWQYQEYGSLYILHALWAQRTKESYNYGGLDRLREIKRMGGQLSDFNFEQQADIIEDYYLIKHGYRPQWGSAGPEDLLYYEYYLRQVKV